MNKMKTTESTVKSPSWWVWLLAGKIKTKNE